MSLAEQQVAQEIVDALGLRVAEWERERSAIEVMRSKQDRKEQRYELLGQFIAAARSQIDSSSAQLAPVLTSDADVISGESK